MQLGSSLRIALQTTRRGFACWPTSLCLRPSGKSAIPARQIHVDKPRLRVISGQTPINDPSAIMQVAPTLACRRVSCSCCSPLPVPVAKFVHRMQGLFEFAQRLAVKTVPSLSWMSPQVSGRCGCGTGCGLLRGREVREARGQEKRCSDGRTANRKNAPAIYGFHLSEDSLAAKQSKFLQFICADLFASNTLAARKWVGRTAPS